MSFPSRPQQLRTASRREAVANVLIAMGFVGMLSAVVLAAATDHGQPVGQVEGGQGTTDDPYQLASCRQLEGMAQAPRASYVLIRDIDCSASGTWNGGAGFFPIGYYGFGFSGTLDGAGHTIRGLTIKRPQTDSVGLFGKLDAGSRVEHLSLEADIHGRENVGAVAGWMMGGTIRDVRTTGFVRGQAAVGGMVGVLQGTILQAESTVRVEAAQRWAGGIAGWNYTAALIDGAVAGGAVSGKQYVGGIAGVNHGGTIRRSRSSAELAGKSDIGLLVGFLVGNGNVVSVLKDSTASSHGSSYPLVGSTGNATMIKDAKFR